MARVPRRMSDGDGHWLDIRRLPLAGLRPADYNPRTISAAAKAGLAASINRWGCVEPVIWNQRSGNVVGGHQRLDALAARGDVETDVVVVDLDAVEEKALNVALNNQAIAGEWDWGKLSALLPEIAAVEGLDAALLGFGALVEMVGLEVPDFGPVPEDSQGRLDQKSPTTCPECGHVFIP